ncbi:MATE family efflux transporter [Anaerocolumna jejuensis]|uniref:MATE family efflux transporter n=1 Tax=Anaerocolumna jejuensis TaxID=259063 RepID=UPI003F7C4B4A
MEKDVQLQAQSVPRLIVSLSAPAILSLLVNSINMAIDRIFVARGVGTMALSAVTISLGVYLLLQGFSLLIAAGSSISIALRLGKNDKEGAEKIIGISMVLSVLLSLALTAAGLVFLKPLLTLYGANSENIGFAVKYSTVIVAGAVFFVLAQNTNNLLKGMGYAKRAFVNFVISIVINAVLNPIFIFVFKMGIIGSALATVIGNIVCTVLAIQFLCSKKSMAQMKIQNIGLNRSFVKEITTTGIPACIMQLALSLVSLTFNHVAAAHGGNTSVAAYGIIYSVIMLVYMPIMGLGQGIQPIFGYNYSSGNYDRVKQTLEYAMVYATIFSVISFGIIELFSGQIAALFSGSGSSELISMASQGMRLFCIMLPVVGFQMIGANYFQYIGKVKQSVILIALRQLILLIPLVVILPKWFQITGIWIATPVSDFISFVITAVLVYQEIKLINQFSAGDSQSGGKTG